MRHATLTGAVKPRVENPKLVVDAMIKQSVFMLIELLDSRPVEPTLLRHARVGQAEAVHRNREGIFVAVHDMICENRVSIQVLGQAQSLPCLLFVEHQLPGLCCGFRELGYAENASRKRRE